MQFIPTKWIFKKNFVIHSVQVCGESPESGAFQLMLCVATTIINIASKFNGKVTTANLKQKISSANLSISFSLIFPNNIQRKDFMEFGQATNIN